MTDWSFVNFFFLPFFLLEETDLALPKKRLRRRGEEEEEKRKKKNDHRMKSSTFASIRIQWDAMGEFHKFIHHFTPPSSYDTFLFLLLSLSSYFSFLFHPLSLFFLSCLLTYFLHSHPLHLIRTHNLWHAPRLVSLSPSPLPLILISSSNGRQYNYTSFDGRREGENFWKERSREREKSRERVKIMMRKERQECFPWPDDGSIYWLMFMIQSVSDVREAREHRVKEVKVSN